MGSLSENLHQVNNELEQNGKAKVMSTERIFKWERVI